MRKLINFTHATVDGFIDNPQDWWLPYVDDGVQRYELEMHLAADAMLLGRVTHEHMAAAWPAMSDHPFAAPFVEHVNSITHYVVATQPVDATLWEPTVVMDGANLIDEVRRLKQTDGGDILMWGTGQLSDALGAAGLLDEYRISTAPVIKGGGEPLFRPASAGVLEHVDTHTFASGAVIHTYRPITTA
ncbi:MAG: dihydrofolate reductase family protein [Acidimicrobiales bacterium]